MSKKEVGPIYSIELIDVLPLGDGGWMQQMPSRADLIQTRRVSERTAAGYEVLLSKFKAALAALQPFANCACDEPHINEPPCNNCAAKAIIAKAGNGGRA